MSETERRKKCKKEKHCAEAAKHMQFKGLSMAGMFGKVLSSSSQLREQMWNLANILLTKKPGTLEQ